MAHDRFTLEESIMGAWNTADTYKMLLKNIDSMSVQEVKAVLSGTTILVDLAFTELFSEFEESIKANSFKDKQ